MSSCSLRIIPYVRWGLAVMLKIHRNVPLNIPYCTLGIMPYVRWGLAVMLKNHRNVPLNITYCTLRIIPVGTLLKITTKYPECWITAYLHFVRNIQHSWPKHNRPRLILPNRKAFVCFFPISLGSGDNLTDDDSVPARPRRFQRLLQLAGGNDRRG